MDFRLDGSGEILGRTPDVLRTLLRGLPNDLLRTSYGPGTWSPHDVVGHLIHGDRTDWMPRVRQIMAHGEAVVFEAFDRNGHADICREHTTSELLDLFASLRRANLSDLHSMSLTAIDMMRRGQHPSFGPVTLAQLLSTWVVHDLNHIAQICKALAFQHYQEVGPWVAYLSILAPPTPR
jgi:hypothetical protein